ncbi:hypothetical protein MVEN_00345900 [Mycena venus]|uniref:Uncharacterized protein n=1 Tax=Mycena venus TaxID=2733690 RepID=A0A8H6YVT1_9AGAR|nr:hypothetical protein MVEN_00345900 [Mycena venus]
MLLPTYIATASIGTATSHDSYSPNILPAANGGAMLTQAPGKSPSSDEPLNVIISGNSDPIVLANNKVAFAISGCRVVNECLAQHEGAPQTADLRDGNDYLNESSELRWDYTDPSLGTCEEPVKGGNHFRHWVQNGMSVSSGVYFLATSYEMPIPQGHNIVVNGYNLGRDWLIGNITKAPIDTASLTNTSTFTGTTSYGGYTYSSAISYVPGLLANSSDGVNHMGTVGVNGSSGWAGSGGDDLDIREAGECDEVWRCGQCRPCTFPRPVNTDTNAPASATWGAASPGSGHPYCTFIAYLDRLRAGTDPTTHTHARYEDGECQTYSMRYLSRYIRWYPYPKASIAPPSEGRTGMRSLHPLPSITQNAPFPHRKLPPQPPLRDRLKLAPPIHSRLKLHLELPQRAQPLQRAAPPARRPRDRLPACVPRNILHVRLEIPSAVGVDHKRVPMLVPPRIAPPQRDLEALDAGGRTPLSPRPEKL